MIRGKGSDRSRGERKCALCREASGSEEGEGRKGKRRGGGVGRGRRDGGGKGEGKGEVNAWEGGRRKNYALLKWDVCV